MRQGSEEHRSGARRGEEIVASRAVQAVRAQRYRVLLFNDDFTPMDFVVQVLERIFGKAPLEATAIMLRVHHEGVGLAGVYVREIAETKVAQVHAWAQHCGHPLRAGLEPA